MSARILLILATGFWLVMNVLLWRAEYGRNGALGPPVDVMSVWKRVLTAPDDSSLAVYLRGERVGFCRWSVNESGDPISANIADDEVLPEDMVQVATDYTVNLEGNASLGDRLNRFRFSLFARFSTNHVWREFDFKANFRPLKLEIHALAESERVSFAVQDSGADWRREFSFAELRQPQTLLAEMGGSATAGLLALLPGAWTQGTLPPTSADIGLKWDARQDWLKIGRAQTRTFRLRSQLLDRYQATVYLSRAGEILRVELPNDLLLLNDALVPL